MVRKKILFSTLIMAIILSLTAIGGLWKQSQAQGTVPTEVTPTEEGSPSKPTRTPEPIHESEGTIGDKGGTVGIDRKGVRWGCVEYKPSVLKENVYIKLFMLPVTMVPHREQLIFHRKVLQVAMYVNNQKTESNLPPYTVCFDLLGVERYIYDNYPDQIHFFEYDSQNETWQECQKVTFDPDASRYGTLMCETDHTGLFTLGKRANNTK